MQSIMKKEYINPQMVVVKMETMSVIAGSDFGNGTKSPGEACADSWYDNEEDGEDW